MNLNIQEECQFGEEVIQDRKDIFNMINIFKNGSQNFTVEKFQWFELVFSIVLPDVFKETLIIYKGVDFDYDYLDQCFFEGKPDPRSIYSGQEVVTSLETFFDEEYFFNRLSRHSFFSEYMISKSLIFFASDGAGRYFFFDYALEKNGKVPIVIVMPDADAEERGRYIADDFGQFLEMLGNPEMEAPYYTIEYPYTENNE